MLLNGFLKAKYCFLIFKKEFKCLDIYFPRLENKLLKFAFMQSLSKMQQSSLPFVLGLNQLCVCCFGSQSVCLYVYLHWHLNAKLINRVSSASTPKHHHTVGFHLECRKSSLLPIIISSLRPCSNTKEAQRMENSSSNSSPHEHKPHCSNLRWKRPIKSFCWFSEGKWWFSSLSYMLIYLLVPFPIVNGTVMGLPPLPGDWTAQSIIDLSIRAWDLFSRLNHLCFDFHFHHSSCCPLGPH